MFIQFAQRFQSTRIELNQMTFYKPLKFYFNSDVQLKSS